MQESEGEDEEVIGKRGTAQQECRPYLRARDLPPGVHDSAWRQRRRVEAFLSSFSRCHVGVAAGTAILKGRPRVAVTPRGRFSPMLSCADCPCIAARRARMFARPVPPPEVLTKPCPESATSRRSWPASTLALMR